MAGLNARIGKAAATGLLAGAMGGVALLAGEMLAAKARRYAKPTMGLALRTTMGRLSAPSLRPSRRANGPGCSPRAAPTWASATCCSPA
jgi:hypothetical protein